MNKPVQLPPALLSSLQGLPGFSPDAFIATHQAGEQVTSLRLNPRKPIAVGAGWQPVPLAANGFYLPERPSFTFDPLFHAGTYYVQEASSMFLEQAIVQHIPQTDKLRVLDLCAAPGGKSTHLQSLLPPGTLLVSNEVIRTRVPVLRDNLVKWGGDNVVVTQNDPSHFQRLGAWFDIMVVDAPCSGSGLFRRDPGAISEWSESNVALCAGRQQRILEDCWPALKEDGLLIYSTCSFSREEDEAILNWILDTLPGAEPVALTVPAEWNITSTAAAKGGTGYRFWPDKIKGEGFFLACFRKKITATELTIKIKQQPEKLNTKEQAMVKHWLQGEDLFLLKQDNRVYAWPADLAADMTLLRQQLSMAYSGVLAGEMMRDKMVPDHALAMNLRASNEIPRIGVDFATAIAYLQKKDIQLPEAAKGWQLLCYEDQPLGWVNVLSNRVNNYYPKELRILKEHA